MHKKAPKLGKIEKRSREVGMRVLDRRTTLKAGGAALAAPFLVRVAKADETVNVYNWPEYIGETTLDDFRKTTGIKVI
jgi:spermidine/putrescine-binding protein